MKLRSNLKVAGLLLVFASLAFIAPRLPMQTADLTLRVEGPLILGVDGNTVLLRGINKVNLADNPDGVWMGDILWTDENVKAELDAMKTWGVNTIRCHLAVENWEYDIGPTSGHPSSPYCAISHRDAVKRLLTFAAERDMYVILDGYSIRNYWTGGNQDPLPYPPYQTSQDASDVIASENDFVDWWIDMASELQSYQNVIFELWNEPEGDEVAMQSWLNVMQQCINAIRSVGADQIIIVQRKTGSWVNLDFPPPSGTPDESWVTLDWILTNPLTDPLGNIVYSTHIYRNGGAFHHTQPTRWNAWEYAEIEEAFNLFKIPEVTENYPLLIGETGANIALSDVELEHELSAWNSILTLFEVNGLHYTAFWWREIGIFRLIETSSTPFTPTASGIILKNALLKTPSEPPIIVGGEGVLTVATSDNGVAVITPVRVYGTSYDETYSSPFSIGVPSGNYTLYTSFGDETYSRNTTITSGETVTETFEFTTETPSTLLPPPQTVLPQIGIDIYSVLGGGLIVGAVGFALLPKRKRGGR